MHSTVIIILGVIASSSLFADNQIGAQPPLVLHQFSELYRVNNDGAWPEGQLLADGSTIFGTTPEGGTGRGTIYRVNTDGTAFTNLHNFTFEEGQTYAGLTIIGNALYGTLPTAIFTINIDGTGFRILKRLSGENEGVSYSELLVCNGKLFGTTQGGVSGYGSIFTLDSDGGNFSTLHRFTGTDGAGPDQLSLSDRTLFGATYIGGDGGGTVFKIDCDGGNFSVIHTFGAVADPTVGIVTNTDGAFPYSRLIPSGDVLYGSTSSGGPTGSGVLFKVHADGSGFSNLYNSSGANSLALSGNSLYGVGHNLLFRMRPDGGGFTVLRRFTGGIDGSNPSGLVLFGEMLFATTTYGPNAGTVFKEDINTGRFETICVFDPIHVVNEDGASPNDLIVQDDTLYGTTASGGPSGNGNVFRLNADGTGFITLHNFAPLNDDKNADGAWPQARLVLAGDTLYGIASEGGVSGDGTLFALRTNGSAFSLLHSFAVAGGSKPNGLILSGERLYGTTMLGGDDNAGIIFGIGIDGTGFRVLHPFIGGDQPGLPHGVTLSGNVLCGTTSNVGYGTVYAINTDGIGFKILHNFTGEYGPPGAHLLASGNILYGCTSASIFKLNTDGTDFATIAKDIDSVRSLSLLSDETFIGTIANGGWPFPPFGSVFALNIAGNDFQTIYRFTPGEDGIPAGAVMLSGGKLFGQTSERLFLLPLLPRLSMLNSGRSTVLTWPERYAGVDFSEFDLQSTVDLGSPDWTPVSATPTSVGRQRTVTLSSESMRFFRLHLK